MRSESPEERGRQKVTEPPSYRIENEYNPEAIRQYFQISVGVLEGRNYTWLNSKSAISYVVIMLGKKKCRTTIRRNKQEPRYGEYFTFGMYSSEYDLQRSTLSLSVMEPRCCAPPRLLGEANIDLGTVWRQPYFQPFRKWIQLSLNRDPTAGSMGFLKVDITVSCRGGVRMMPPAMRDNNIEINYLSSSGLEQQHANFIITVHGAFALPNSPRLQNERKHCAKPPNTFARVLFRGLQAKTSVQNRTNNPTYNEQVSMVEMFPNSNPMLRFEICSTDTYANRLLASKSLNLDHISHDGENGFLPTFGPSLLTMYGSSSGGNFTPNGDSPFYRGSLLVSLNIVVPYYQQSVRSISVEPVAPISLENLWTLKNFCIFCPIFELSMLDSRLVRDLCGVAITIGEIPTESTADEEFIYMMKEVKTRKLHYTGSLDVLRNTTSDFGYLDFSNSYPVLQSNLQLPDYRFRLNRNNSIYRIVRTLESTLTKVEHRLKNVDYTPKDLHQELTSVLNAVANTISQFLNNNSDVTYENEKQVPETELDKKQLILRTEEMKRIREKILEKLSSDMTKRMSRCDCIGIKCGGEDTSRSVKRLLSEMHTLTQELGKLIYKTTEGWPDIVIWLLNDGSRVAYCKIPVADIIYSNIPDECGILCGKIHSMYFKPLKCSKHVNSLSMGCFCDVGKVELLAWMGLHEQSPAFEPCLPNGYTLKVKDVEMSIKCDGIVPLYRTFTLPYKMSQIHPDCLEISQKEALRLINHRIKQQQLFHSVFLVTITATLVDKEKSSVVVEFLVYIHKARLLCNNIGGNLDHVYIRINALNTTQDSKAIEKSPTPVWNQLLRFRKMLYTSSERLLKYPPAVLVEVNSTNLLDKTELIGRFQMDSMLEEKEIYTPKLRWYEMYKGRENTGKVLMSVQILPVAETILKSTIYTAFQERFTASDMKEMENSLSNTNLPADFIPRTSTYKLDIYWWGLRNVNITKKPYAVMEIEDLIVKSEVITDKKSNCNFPNGRVSYIFEASFTEHFCPSINVKLFDNCTFGRTLYIGTSIVKKPYKFFTYWYPKSERETTLKYAAITSGDFMKVNQTLYIKKKPSTLVDDNEQCKQIEKSYKPTNIRIKRKFWRRLFCKKELDEEEYTLLPTCKRKCPKIINKKIQATEKNDWWSRYAHSQKVLHFMAGWYQESNIKERCNTMVIKFQNHVDGENAFFEDTFVIYDSELEDQPRFSKFKDWCATLKFYNGEKIGILERDKELQCGYLKAGIAIYKWPPPESIVAVSMNGVNLDQGFFHDYPSNDSAKFVVRVYVIKGIDLITKDISGKIHPFVIISCGNKQLGDRSRNIPNTCNPVFGTVYELRCNLPEEYQLTVSVYNHDLIEPDELIGSTTIDLENRIYTKHKARVGLASEYNLFEPGKWRDCIKPSVILEEICMKNHLPLPTFPSSSSIMVNGVEYKDNEKGKKYASTLECRENVCLSLLRNWDNIPICGYQLVPEHVETRSLYHPDVSGIVQGKLHMWIDIFPIDSAIYIPPPVDVTPKKTEEYELRVTILKVKLFEEETNGILPKASYLYIRAWSGFVNQIQNAYCNTVSSDGYYIFNHSMIFNFSYDYAERKLVKKERNQFTDFEETINPELYIQIMDSDSLSLDEPIGYLALNLNEMPHGERNAVFSRDVNVKTKTVDLFTVTSNRAWRLLNANDNNENIVGAVEMEVMLLPKQKTLVVPVALERDLRTSSIQDNVPKLRGDSLQSNYDFKKFFYKHNALWGSLTGVSVIILCIVIIIYIIIFMI